MKCPSCGKENDPTEKWCTECGAALETLPLKEEPKVEEAVSGVQCPSCSKMNLLGAKFCIECGASLAQVPPPPPLPPPPSPPPPPSAPAVPKARLILPNNSEIAVTEAIQMIGRGEFERAVSADNLKYISRVQADQGKFHFRTSFENGKFYVEDLNSTNGTKLNGAEIKGKGKQELKDGDKLEIAEVVTVTFKIS